MIRINLLPVRELKRRAALKNQVTMYFVAIVAVLALMGFLYWTNQTSYQDRVSLKEELDVKKKDLEEKVKKVTELTQKQELLQRKIDIIAEREAKRAGPLQLLVEISRNTPDKSAWLESLAQAQSTVTLGGLALNLETVANYTESLKEREFFSEAKMGNVNDENRPEIRLKRFVITCTIAPPKVSEEDMPAGQKNAQTK